MGYAFVQVLHKQAIESLNVKGYISANHSLSTSQLYQKVPVNSESDRLYRPCITEERYDDFGEIQLNS